MDPRLDGQPPRLVHGNLADDKRPLCKIRQSSDGHSYGEKFNLYRKRAHENYGIFRKNIYYNIFNIIDVISVKLDDDE